MAAIFKLLCLGRPRLIYDQRGDNVAEFLYSLPSDNRARLTLRQRISLDLIYFMEWFGILFSNRILYVTEHLRSIVERRYTRAKSKPSAVFPCLADAEKIQWRPDKRNEIRDRLKVGDDHIVLTYGGSLDKYQCLDEMMALFGEMRKQNRKVIMLLMTNVINHEAIESRLKHIADSEFWRVIEVHHIDMSDYLSAGDLGLLLREPSPVNESAAPTKFAEYVMSGLPIVVSSGIGDYSGLALEKNWGVVWDDLNKIDELAKACLEWIVKNGGVAQRERIAFEARERLGRQSRINDYRAFLHFDN
jgi:glycosyltransferase involved in cell wall biosynthesis